MSSDKRDTKRRREEKALLEGVERGRTIRKKASLTPSQTEHNITSFHIGPWH